MSDDTVDFAVLCTMLEAIVRAKKATMKRKHLRTFLDHVYTRQEYFSAMRLMLPELDKERGTYGLKEAVLAKFLAEALGLAKDSADAQKLLNWRKGGSKAGRNAGNFPMIAAEVLYQRQSSVSHGLKIREVNDLLDRLSAAQSREERTATLAEIISKTNTLEMRWIIMIILKDLKLGVSEKTIFAEFHPDAEDLFNVTCDLKLVCDKLKDRSRRVKRQEIEVGKAVRPQLAARVANVESAWKKLRGKRIVAECKLDGDRIQVHKNGSELHFFSRSFIDHDQYQDAIAGVMREGIISEKCILDGEMLVWNRVTNRFSEFGTNRGIAKATKDGLEGDEQLCYVAFDILYEGDGSVIHQSLAERHKLLRKAVHPVKGRLELLLPNEDLNSSLKSGGPPWSILVNSMQEAEQFFLQTVENRDEGVVLKDLDSKWEPSDRSGKWLKLKPDYINTGSDLDVLIIGGYFGSGRKGGEVGQFLLGLAEKSQSSDYPTRFLSFCKVGSGLSDEETQMLVTKLKPYFRPYDKNSKPPSCYVVTNNAKERPDVWIEPPEKSVILAITSDIRTIKTEVFAAPYSLRFPRVDCVRFDKPWYDCLDLQTLVEIVHSGSGSTVDAAQYGDGEHKEKRLRQPRQRAEPRALLPSHILVTDVSKVKQTSKIFKDMMFYFVNFSPDYSKETLHKLIVENGGSFSMNLASGVTHIIAADKKGIKYQAAQKQGDVISCEWVVACAAEKALVPLTPKYFLHLSSRTKEKTGADVDEFGDFFFKDVDVTDIQQLFDNMDFTKLKVDKDELSACKEICNLKVDNDELSACKEICCSSSNWCTFRGCKIYFLPPGLPPNSDELKVAEITLRRLKLEVSMREGEVDITLKDASHLIVYSTPGSTMSVERIFESFDVGTKHLLRSKKLHVVSHEWLEKAITICSHLPEADYELRESRSMSSESKTVSAQTPPSHVLERARLQQNKGKSRGRSRDASPEDCVSPLEDNRNRSRRRLSKRRLVMNEGAALQHSPGWGGPTLSSTDKRANEEVRHGPGGGALTVGCPDDKRRQCESTGKLYSQSHKLLEDQIRAVGSGGADVCSQGNGSAEADTVMQPSEVDSGRHCSPREVQTQFEGGRHDKTEEPGPGTTRMESECAERALQLGSMDHNTPHVPAHKPGGGLETHEEDEVGKEHFQSDKDTQLAAKQSPAAAQLDPFEAILNDLYPFMRG